MSEFCHLHLHSEYSLLDGAIRVSDIPKKVKSLGQKAVALTDHGVMYGAVNFYDECVREGIKPIIGCEIYMAPRTRFDKQYPADKELYHLVLLVKNETGYKNLCSIVSRAFTEGFYGKMRADSELLEKHHEGLICLSACLGGYIPQSIINSRYDEAERYAVYLNNLFGEGNFYLELQNHFLPLQKTVNDALLKISKANGIPLAATNDAHYTNKEDSHTQSVLMCVQMNTHLSEGRPLGFETDEFYIKSSDEMSELFFSYPGAIENTSVIADKCNFKFEFGKIYLPRFKCPDGKKADIYVKELVYASFDNYIAEGKIVFTEGKSREEYKKRIEYELSVIEKTGYAEYFLITHDYVKYAKDHGIATGPGRGSGAGSLISFLMNITEIDPLKYDLLFERFLNPERVSMPDFDIDFCDTRRDEVYDYVESKYGSDRVSHIITFGTMAPRAAIRDVGRVMGVSYAKADEIAKSIPNVLGITFDMAMQSEAFKSLYNSDSESKKLIDTARAIEGMPRHASTHAAGVVIAEKSLDNYLPLAVNNGSRVTQYDMKNIEKLGLLKFDFLGLRYLTIIENTIEQIREEDQNFIIESIPTDKKEVYEMLSSGLSDGVFQLESQGMRNLLTTLKPVCLEDIMLAIALYRPGPMKSIQTFLTNRANPEKIEYICEEMKNILSPTFGVIVYQEQVMQIFSRLAGYSFGRADIVRKAMSKKKADILENERHDFIYGALATGISEKEATELFDSMSSFAEYAFNKSHAVSYGLIAYRTAYLKCFYREKYYAALLTSVMSDPLKTGEYIDIIKKQGINVSPPDINDCFSSFRAKGNMILYGLLAIKNVGGKFIESIIKERESGIFTSFENFITRLSGKDINKRQIEYLIKAGAFDKLGIERSRLLAGYENLIDLKCGQARKADIGQIDLFSSSDKDYIEKDSYIFPSIRPLSEKERLAYEKEATGVYFSGHPIDNYSIAINKLNPDKIIDILNCANEDLNITDRSKVTIAGFINTRKDKQTKTGKVMCFITLEDRQGEIEVVVFPSKNEKYSPLLIPDRAVCIIGKVSVQEDEIPVILLDHAYILEQNKEEDKNPPESKITANKLKKLYIRVPDMICEKYKKALNLIEIFEGSTPAVFYDESKNKYTPCQKGFDTNSVLLNELENLLGKGNVVYK